MGTDRDDLPGRYLLQSTLDAFQLEPEGEGYAARGHAARPAAAAARPGGRRGTEVHPARAGDRTSNAAAVAAFDAAVSGVLEDLVAWTLRAGRG